MSDPLDPVEDIADALVAYTSALTGMSLTVAASKPEDIQELLKRECADLSVYFVPNSEAAEKIGRGGQCLETFTVNMVVVRKLSPDFTRRRLSAFTRELATRIRGQRMAGYVWSSQETVAKFDPVILNQLNQFTSLTRFTYVAAG